MKFHEYGLYCRSFIYYYQTSQYSPPNSSTILLRDFTYEDHLEELVDENTSAVFLDILLHGEVEYALEAYISGETLVRDRTVSWEIWRSNLVMAEQGSELYLSELGQFVESFLEKIEINN